VEVDHRKRRRRGLRREVEDDLRRGQLDRALNVAGGEVARLAGRAALWKRRRHDHGEDVEGDDGWNQDAERNAAGALLRRHRQRRRHGLFLGRHGLAARIERHACSTNPRPAHRRRVIACLLRPAWPGTARSAASTQSRRS
jgi:hypothetical protein